MVRLVVSTDSSDLHLFGGPKSGLNLSVDSENPDISMIAAEGNGEERIAFSEHGPSFTLQDAMGFSTIVGGARRENGESQVWNFGLIHRSAGQREKSDLADCPDRALSLSCCLALVQANQTR